MNSAATAPPPAGRRRRRRPDLINLSLRAFAALVFLFLLTPIATTVLFAFNQGVLGKQTARFTGFTTKWFSAALNDPTLTHSLAVSAKVAAAVAAIAVVLGTATGIAIVRHPWRPMRFGLEMTVYYLLVVPEIVLGLSLLIFFSRAHMQLGYLTLIAGHSPFPIAVVTIIIRSRVVALDRALEDASADLGAPSWATLRDVILPQLRPAMLAGLIMSFAFSFDDLIISQFLTTPTVTTLPVFMFGEAHSGVTPNIYAIATIMLAITMTALAAVGIVYRVFGRRTGQRSSLVGALGGQGDTTAGEVA
jgi:ABC-type spermidine/putrescine transport system permease subunit II